MTEIPRLNGVVAALEAGRPTFTTFTTADIQAAISLSATRYDGIVFEMEHNPWDIRALRDSLQYMLSRGQIASSGSVAPAVTPMVRIPPNGGEMAQWHAKQALDLGVYGVVWPHVSSVDQAYNAVAACRYPRLQSAPLYEPAGIRGDGPRHAVRYWGLSQQDYYRKADVWPLAPDGEIFVILMIEDTAGIESLADMLDNVPGIGAVLIGEGGPQPGARLPPAIRPSRGARRDGEDRRHLQVARRRRRPPPCRRGERRAGARGGATGS